MRRLLASFAAVSLFTTLVGCASTSVQLSGDRPVEGLCQPAGQNVSALVLWGTQWRADQKDIPQREAATELGLTEYFAKSGCFTSFQLIRRATMSALTPQSAREAARSASSAATRVVAVTVRELGPVVKLLSSAALVEGGTEVVLQVQSFELSAPSRMPDFTVHWKDGGPGVIKGVATLSKDMQAAVAAAFGP